MLVIGLIRAVLFIANLIAGLFPNADISAVQGTIGGWQNVLASILVFDTAFPVHEMIDAMAVYGTILLAVQGGGVLSKMWHAIKW